ncbi:MAG: TetR/AcrR family transcriptional regulator [Dethiobacter sp.]|jgi:AcrR family transcriptional regulator|nr:MAG: TetR/AcrR family transcriptional regulator [Dethiobacter sp.]
MKKNNTKKDRKETGNSFKREELLKITTKYFYEQGYDNTSTRDIAKASGLSIAGLYYYFKNKESILFNIIDKSVENLYKSLIDATNSEDSPKTNLSRIIEKVFKEVIESHMEIGLLFKEDHRLTQKHLKLINKKRRMCLEIVKREIARLKETGELKPSLNITSTAFSLIAMTNWPHFWYDPNRSITIEELSNEIKEIFFDGILIRS